MGGRHLEGRPWWEERRLLTGPADLVEIKLRRRRRAKKSRHLVRPRSISGASSHSGRRTLITRLAERGIDLKAIAGHSSIRTTAVYVESNPRRLARILQDVTW
jgi:hypothetical protein